MRKRPVFPYTVQALAYSRRRRVAVLVTKEFRVRHWKRAQTALRLLLEREGFKVERVANFGQLWKPGELARMGGVKPEVLVQSELAF